MLKNNPELIKFIYEFCGTNKEISNITGINHHTIGSIRNNQCHLKVTKDLTLAANLITDVYHPDFPEIINSKNVSNMRIRRFLDKIKFPEGDIKTECWQWKGAYTQNRNYSYPLYAGLENPTIRPSNGNSHTAKGFEPTSYTGRMMSAIRFSYETFYPDSIKTDNVICHIEECENNGLHRKCVSPFHIFQGTHKQNMEMKDKHQTPEKIASIKAVYVDDGVIKILAKKHGIGITYTQKIRADKIFTEHTHDLIRGANKVQS